MSDNLSTATAEPPVKGLADLKSKSKPKEPIYYKSNGSGGTYWCFIEQDERWVSVGTKLVECMLKGRGFEDYNTGTALTALERESLRIATRCRVHYAGPLAGYKMGVYEFEGESALVTKSMELIQPQKGNWDTLDKVFQGAFKEEGGFDQRLILFGWWQHALRALYSGHHTPGAALVLAGERESGKSLLAELIKETLGKKFSQPYAWMTGKDNFNEEIFESVLQLIDDENANTHLPERLKFGASIKQMVAVPGARCRGMHQKASTLRPLWRLLICLNMEPDRLMVLPPLDDDVEDKMLILKASQNKMPMPANTEAERTAFWNQLSKELPCFIHWLLEEFELPRDLQGRFGVRFWHHPEVVSELRAVSPEQQILEFIERWFKKKNWKEWTGPPSELRQELLSEGILTQIDQKLIPNTAWMGRRLRLLRDQFPDYYSSDRNRRGSEWTIKRMAPLENDVTQL